MKEEGGRGGDCEATDWFSAVMEGGGTHIVGGGDLLEEGVVLQGGVLVRVVLQDETAVGLPELVVGGVAADAEHLVVVRLHGWVDVWMVTAAAASGGSGAQLGWDWLWLLAEDREGGGEDEGVASSLLKWFFFVCGIFFFYNTHSFILAPTCGSLEGAKFFSDGIYFSPH